MSPCSDCARLRETLQMAHDAYQHERMKSEVRDYEVDRLNRRVDVLSNEIAMRDADIEILREALVEANNKSLRGRIVCLMNKINWRKK